jgi:uncharacterized protein involved in type VI secretion and phage assembly
VEGIGGIKLLDVMQIDGVGERWNGTTVVTGIRHSVTPKGWITDVQFGLPPEEFARRADIMDAPAAGILPGAQGLQLGIVMSRSADPDKEARVQVWLPSLDPKQGESVWAYHASPDAGSTHGVVFRPEPNDQVIVGFLNNDPRCPVILGSLFGSKNKIPEPLADSSENNEKRGIVTKQGSKIGFLDGEKPSVFIETKAANKLVLDDDAKGIKLTDQHGNSITMGENGIEIVSKGKLTIKADQAVEIDGSEVNVK